MNANPERGRSEASSMLRGVVEGTRDGHIWRSPEFGDADVQLQFRWAGVKVDPSEHYLPKPFADRISLEYKGKITREYAAQRLAELQAGARAAESVV